MRAALFLFLLGLATLAEGSDFVGSDLLIPIAGRTSGAHGSKWQTDILITNTSRTPTIEPVTIVFRRDGAPDGVFSTAIDSRATLILRDAVRATFGQDDGVGTIRILASDTAALSARARIYNIASQSGEFGLTVQAVAVSELPREAWLPGLNGLGHNRTNVGIANGTAVDAVAVLTLWDRNGEMRRGITLEIPGGESLVLNDVFSHLGSEPLDGATIHVVASQPFYAWASIVRSDSGDADFVAASSR
jgi:hypothetical protein